MAPRGEHLLDVLEMAEQLLHRLELERLPADAGELALHPRAVREQAADRRGAVRALG